MGCLLVRQAYVSAETESLSTPHLSLQALRQIGHERGKMLLCDACGPAMRAFKSVSNGREADDELKFKHGVWRLLFLDVPVMPTCLEQNLVSCAHVSRMRVTCASSLLLHNTPYKAKSDPYSDRGQRAGRKSAS